MADRLSVRDDLALMEGYHSPQVQVDVRLNTNESPVPPPAEWQDELAAELARVQWHRYPQRAAGELRAALAELHGVEAEQVFAANGSNEVLQCLLLAFGGPGRAAAVFEPTYALHSHIARLTGTAVVTGERNDDYRLPLDQLRRLVDSERPAITFLCSPNNPTGIVEAPELVAAALRAVAELPGLLVVDEAYGQFATHSALELFAEDVPLAVSRTFSKTWSMAAARLGYVIAPRWIVSELEKVVLPYHLDAVKQIAGRLALQHVDAMRQRVADLVAERERMVAALDGLAVDQWPSGANFVLFRPREMPGQQVWDELLARSVLVRNCSSWPRLSGCLRVTIGTPGENDAFVDALAEILEQA